MVDAVYFANSWDQNPIASTEHKTECSVENMLIGHSLSVAVSVYTNTSLFNTIQEGKSIS